MSDCVIGDIIFNHLMVMKQDVLWKLYRDGEGLIPKIDRATVSQATQIDIIKNEVDSIGKQVAATGGLLSAVNSETLGRIETAVNAHGSLITEDIRNVQVMFATVSRELAALHTKVDALSADVSKGLDAMAELHAKVDALG